MYSRKTYGDLNVNLNGYTISGIQSFDGSYELPNENVLSYGYGVARAVNNNIIGNISFEKYIVGQDNLFSLISGSISGFLNYDGGVFGFNKGYINSYTVEANVNDKPTLNVNFTAYGNVGSGISGGHIQSPVTWYYQTVTRGDVSLNINNQETTNRVTNFNYSININRKPIYLLGEQSPSYVLVTWPIEVTTSFILELDNYQFQEISGQVCSPKEKDIVIQLRACGSTGIVATYKAPRAKLLGESINGSIGQNTSVNITYKSYVNSFSELL